MSLLRNFLVGLMRTTRWAKMRVRGVQIDRPDTLAAGIWCRRGFSADRAGQIIIGPGARLDRGVLLDAFGGTIRLGEKVFLGPSTVIYGHGGVEIGDDCLIAMHCRILSSNHTVPPLGTPINTMPDELRPTRIGRDVWLGAGVTVLGGVTIGDGCVVGAGSVVTSDLPEGTIALGVPARVHSRRAGANQK